MTPERAEATAGDVEEMAERLAAAEETLRAILAGEIDALVVETDVGERIFTLAGADQPYRVMVESMQEGAATVSERGVVLYANRRLGEMLQTPLRRLIGEPVTAFVTPEERGAFERLLRDAADTPVHAEATLQAERGVFPVAVAASPLDLDDARTVCLVITDLSEQKRVEQNLAVANERLERRTVALVRSNRELEQFAYIASHDLQAPLRTIRGFVDLLVQRSEDVDATAAEYMAYITEAVERMRQLIDDLLQFSRVGTTGRSFEPTDAEAALEHVVMSLHAAIAETAATITHDPLPTVRVDTAQFQQLLQNLIENALKFHGEEPPRVHVAARRGRGEWEFSVSDNGIGLDPRFSEKILVAFQRLHPHGVYAGTGIGLAICKKIVERHGGRIGVDSEPGKGATFTFTITDVGAAE